MISFNDYNPHMKELGCKTCVPPKRHPGCHSTCEIYLAWKKDFDEEKAKEKEEQWLKGLGRKDR